MLKNLPGYQSIIEQAIVPIILTKADGKILKVNKAACQLFGYTTQELNDKQLDCIIDHTEIDTFLIRGNANGQQKEETAGIKKNGQRIVLEISYTIFFNESDEQCFCNILQDITARKQAEQEINLLLNHTNESFLLLDNDLHIVNFNRQCAQLYNTRLQLQIEKGRHILDYVQPERKQIATQIYDRVLSGHTERAGFSFRDKNGIIASFACRYAPSIDDNNRIIGAFVTIVDTSAHKQCQQNSVNQNSLLNYAENSYREIFENSSEGILIHGIEDDLLIDVNQAACEMLGAAKENILQTDPADLMAGMPGYTAGVAKEKFAKAAAGNPQLFEWLIRRDDGNLTWVEISVKKANIAGTDRILSFLRLINDRKKAELDKESERQKKEALINNTEDLMWSISSDYKLIAVNHAYGKMMEAVNAKVPEEGDNVFKKEFGKTLNDRWKAYYERALNGEKYSIREEVYNPANQRTEYGLISFCPMYNDGEKPFGVACYSKNITEDTLNRLALEDAKTRLDEIMQSTLDVICTVNPDGLFADVSAASEKVFGYTPGEMIGKPVFDFVFAEDRDKTKHQIDSIRNGNGTNSFTNRYVKKDGSLVTIEWKAKWDEKNQKRYAVARDVTEKIKAEEQKEFEKRNNEALINSTDDLIWSVGVNSNLIAANEAFIKSFREQTGVTLQPGDSMIDKNSFPEAMLKSWQKILGKTLSGASYKKEVYSPPMAKRKEAWFDISFNPIYTNGEVMGIACYARNITDRKKTEEQIKQSQTLLAEAQRLAKLGSWSFDFKADTFTWSDELHHIFGTDKNAFLQTHGSFIKLIDKADKQSVMQTKSHSQKTGKPYVIEYHITTPAGNKKIIQEHGYSEKDSKGNIIRLFGTAQDITESRKNQEELRISEEHYRILFQYSPMPKWIYDLETFQIKDVNLAAISHYGYSLSEFLELTLMDLMPDSEKATLKAKQQVAREGIFYFGLCTHQKKNKSMIQVEVSGNKIMYHGRKCMTVLCNDVTQREITLDLLLDRELKLDNALRIAKLGYWQTDLTNNSLYWSAEVFSIWEYKSSQPDFEFFLSSIHPDDVEAFFKARRAVLNGQKDLDVEHRIVMTDGSIKWVHEKGQLEKNERGEPAFLTGTVQDITAQKLLAVSLAESNQRYKFVAKATSDAIWDWDLVTDMIYWGDGIDSIFGYRYSQLNVHSNFWNYNIHPDDIDKIMKSINAAIEGVQENWFAEYRFLKANNEYAFVTDKGFVIRNEQGKAIRMVGAMQDITQQKQKEQHLKLLESVIINASDAVMIIEAARGDEAEMPIVYINDALTRMTGYTAGELTGKTPKMFHGPQSCRNEMKRLESAIRAEQHCTITTVNYKKNGEAFWIHMSVSPVSNEKGCVTHWIAIARDVTEDKLSAMRLNTLNENLAKHAKELSISNAELEQFAFVASHDLQEPLRMVTSFLMLLEKKYKDVLNDDGKKYISFAVDGAKRMREIILDLLEFSRVGKVEDNMETLDMNKLIGETKLLFRKDIEDKKGVINVGSLPTVYGAQVPLRQVFQNLIGNALKYSKADLPARIDITCTELPAHWQFSVADNGIGIDNAYLDKIFILFQRLHKTTEYAGTGIGLAITKKIIENLGGTIWVNSREQEGSTFNFTLPKIAASDTTAKVIE
ncbi:MAG: sensor signal transduction histidine kinase [Ferruginibacter sp.]|uniref:PAS domain S-box protein n=1 Tax=Ferruginibacter sp. TaxID=1940288 RepID=UPI00265ACB27|nr:PAS domain S-box protein [Ferruginibacter sp.]MDB5277375.1 sensor signal transduction histidine kinase [Ferruginibacter sp.]